MHFADASAWSLLTPTDAVPELSGGVPWADRRLADRFPVRPGSRTEIRRWGVPSGPDMAEELLDVSVVGVRLRLGTPVRRGQRLDVTLWGPGAAWCGRGLGLVRWVVIGEAGMCLAGLRLSRRLTAQALRELVTRPQPRREAPDDDFKWVGVPEQFKPS